MNKIYIISKYVDTGEVDDLYWFDLDFKYHPANHGNDGIYECYFDYGAYHKKYRSLYNLDVIIENGYYNNGFTDWTLLTECQYEMELIKLTIDECQR